MTMTHHGKNVDHRSTTGLVHDVNYDYSTVDQLISQQDTLRAAQPQVFGYDVLDETTRRPRGHTSGNSQLRGHTSEK